MGLVGGQIREGATGTETEQLSREGSFLSPREQRPSGIPIISSRAEVPLSTNQVLLPEHSKGGGVNVGIHFLTLHYHEST